MIFAPDKLGFGMGTIGGMKRRIGLDEAYAMMDAAYESGLRHFDTATWYGAGWAEQLLGGWWQSRGIRRQDIFICTKIARSLAAPTATHPLNAKAYPVDAPFCQIFDYSRHGARRQFQVSCDHLRTNYLDALLLHDIDTRNHGAAYAERLVEAMAGTYQTLQELRDSSLARKIGIGVNNWEPFDDVMRHATASQLDFDCGVLAGRYTLMEQACLPMLARASENSAKVYAAGLFNSGVLTGGDMADARYDYAPLIEASVDIRRHSTALQSFCHHHHIELGALALQFAAAHPAVARCVIGPDSVAELRQCITWMTAEIAPSVWQALRQSSLIDPQSPLPHDEERNENNAKPAPPRRELG